MKKRVCLAGIVAACAALAAVPALAQVSADRIGAGANHTCAITTTGGVRCWGSNTAGELGDGTMIARSVPTDVGLASGIAALALGDSHTCALTGAGTVWCWGNNFHGQLGRPELTLTHSLKPVEVAGLASVKAIAAGAAHTCALTTQGAVRCWGENINGQLGDGTNTARSTPVEALGSGVASLGTGRNHTCAVMQDTSALCWGNNDFGQIGRPRTNSNVPRAVIGLESGAARIVGGDQHSCVLTTLGAARCWGGGSSGQLGSGATSLVADVPVAVPGLASGVVALASYRHHTCAVTSAGAVKCWGWNGSGQLGDATTTTPAFPVEVAGTSGSTAVAAGADHSCAIVPGGGVSCWGNNFAGQLGDGSNTTRLLPARVVAFAGVTFVNTPGMYTGLFWNAAEPGWGLHVTQRGPQVFAAWYTYDESGSPRWYVASNCTFDAVDARICQGTLYEAQGSPYFGAYFSPPNVTSTNVGNLQLSFADRDHVRMAYTLRGVSRQVDLVRPLFGAAASQATDYTDLWWNPAQPGWGLAVAQQGNTMFLAWYVYDTSGRSLWYVAPDCKVGANGNSCSGALYRTRGPAFTGAAFDPTKMQVTPAGSIEATFTDASNGSIRYSVDGLEGDKAIARQAF
jgi:alpha-tubulin suppressor-like RCC1 family protein